jgi:hypothetical protein
MKQNFEIELDDYLDDSDHEEYEAHFKSYRRRRSHDARRQIENLLEQKKLNRLQDSFDEMYIDY